jgi:hypothetical protein
MAESCSATMWRQLWPSDGKAGSVAAAQIVVIGQLVRQ